jgi:hypothetical protein
MRGRDRYPSRWGLCYEGISEAATLEAAAAADSWARTEDVKSAMKIARSVNTVKNMTERMTAVKNS